ncbi:hypothetical protein [Natroniella sp. ANB-PHB2]|uniref:hypothetical protein n=1 Tax=Natroniella sp. ANB-PHB2 TaxID=3384444 RepID=UPI0038D3DA58
MTLTLLSLLLILFVFSMPAFAHCPLCTLGIGFLVVMANKLGVDLVVIGLFAGAFSLSLGMFISRKIVKQNKYMFTILTISSFLLMIIPLSKFSGVDVAISFDFLEGMTNGTYLIDRFVLGSIIGAIVLLSSTALHKKIKEVKGRVFIPFQIIILSMSLLIVTATIMQLII